MRGRENVWKRNKDRVKQGNELKSKGERGQLF